MLGSQDLRPYRRRLTRTGDAVRDPDSDCLLT
jgi:hypothetical protein